MPAEQAAIRTAHAMYPPAGYFRRQGSLMLFPDKLAYVGSVASTFGAAGGLVGMLVGRGVAKARASNQATNAGKGVASVAFADIARVAPAQSKRGRVIGVVVSTRDGREFRFRTLKGEEWVSELVRVLRESGRQVTAGERGHVVS